MRVPIAYAIDDLYVKPLMAQIIALYENAKETTIYDLYILEYQLSDPAREKIVRLVAQLKSHAEVRFLDISEELNREVPSIGSWGKETNYRGLLPSLLPELDRILYLDADTLVLEDLSHLMELNLDEHPHAGAIDPFTSLYRLLDIAKEEGNRLVEKIILNYGYINAGVLLMNLAYWREHNIQAEFLRLLNILHDKKIPCLPDQDVLNYLAIRDGVNRLYYLPSTYNSLYTHMDIPSKDKNQVDLSEDFPIDKLKERAIMALRNRNIKQPAPHLIFDRVVIVHFCGLKPWNRSRESDAFVPLFQAYADRVGLEIPSAKRKLPRLSTLKKRWKQYRNYIVVGLIINTLVIVLFSLLLSKIW